MFALTYPQNCPCPFSQKNDSVSHMNSISKPISMAVDVQYLLGFLEDEFSRFEDIRIHPVAPSGTQKSIDLPQDYDADSNNLHLQRGVRVRYGSRDFFFPASWVNDQHMDLVYAQTKEILELLS
jgi:hypothetical protein